MAKHRNFSSAPNQEKSTWVETGKKRLKKTGWFIVEDAIFGFGAKVVMRSSWEAIQYSAENDSSLK